MKIASVVYGTIETLWLAFAVAFVVFGIAALNDITRRNAETAATVAEYAVRKRVIAAILNDVTRDASDTLIADATQGETMLARRH
jgi:hypothetical protein